jgi:hypothetical protein
MPFCASWVHFGAYREIAPRACIHAEFLVLQSSDPNGIIPAKAGLHIDPSVRICTNAQGGRTGVRTGSAVASGDPNEIRTHHAACSGLRENSAKLSFREQAIRRIRGPFTPLQ